MRILIVGQGIAGTLLGWEFERAGIEFEIVDAGHEQAASRVAAGIINPITGQRLVKSWRVDALLPAAWATYREIENAWGVPVARRMRVWRELADETERATFLAKRARGELAPFATSDVARYAGTEGFWIEPALHVDMPGLIAAARRRWLAQGRLIERRVEVGEESRRRELVLDCAGAGTWAWTFARLERVKGELLSLKLEGASARGVDAEVIRNRGHWFLPLDGGGRAMVGATYERASADLTPSAASKALLETSARKFLGGGDFEVEGHLAGWRVSAPSCRPVAGRIRGAEGIGFINGLGSKGALYAPWMARQWLNHLTEGVGFEE